MKGKNLLYINLVLFISLVIVTFIGTRFFVPTSEEALLKKAGPEAVKPIPIARALQSSYEGILKVRSEEEKGYPKTPPKDLKDVYNNYSEKDAGENIVEAWAKTNPQDKAKFMEGLDKEIKASREILSANPEDRKAKSLLVMSENLKALALTDFNYKMKGSFPKVKRKGETSLHD